MRKLTQRKILDKVFDTKFKGYNPEEVDQFLDIIIRDYRSYDEEIEKLREENERLIKKLEAVDEEPAVKEQTIVASAPSSVTNFDVLKRLSNLEREVFGSKLEEESPAQPSDDQ
ncbi:cell division regulator GpsB [Allofustis seminis]|uniref:cell division regulator GpsB n=1 Tax=Allofustis seminis TaxID=166939 RepID=UPI00035F01C8|nr:cell division regulator GpsB [Allofustis seminis]